MKVTKIGIVVSTLLFSGFATANNGNANLEIGDLTPSTFDKKSLGSWETPERGRDVLQSSDRPYDNYFPQIVGADSTVNFAGVEMGDSGTVGNDFKINQDAGNLGNLGMIVAAPGYSVTNSVAHIYQDNAKDSAARIELRGGNNNHALIEQSSTSLGYNYGEIVSLHNNNSGNNFELVQGGGFNYAEINAYHGSDNDASVTMNGSGNGSSYDSVLVDFVGHGATDNDVEIEIAGSSSGGNRIFTKTNDGKSNTVEIKLSGSVSDNYVETYQDGSYSTATVTLVGGMMNSVLVKQHGNAIAHVNGSGASNNSVGIYQ
jgi:hypothetical protein